ncbi:MAG TPA: zinc ribbon domain-containing protein [Thermoplasmata archaeon]|jgi:hypothetical protein
MKCPGCGTENPDGANYCNNCALDLSRVFEQQPETGRHWTKKLWFTTYNVYPDRSRDFIVIQYQSPITSYAETRRLSKRLWYGTYLFAISVMVFFTIFTFSLTSPGASLCVFGSTTLIFILGSLLMVWLFVWITLIPPGTESGDQTRLP